MIGELLLYRFGTFASSWTASRVRLVEEFHIHEDHTRNALRGAETRSANEMCQRSSFSDDGIYAI